MSKEFEEIMLEKMDSIEKGLSNKIEELDKKFEGKFEGLNDKFESLNNTVLLIEEEVKTNFPALFEIYSLNYDKQKETEKRVKILEKQNFNHSVRIANLETTLEKKFKAN